MEKRRNIIGIRMREARNMETPKATQRDISARLEVLGVPISDNMLGKMENGERSVTDIQLLAIARALRVNPSWLLGLSEEMRFTFHDSPQ